MPSLKSFPLLLTVVILAPVSLYGQTAADSPLELDTTLAKFSTSFESVNMPHGKNMGLVGANIMYKTEEWLALGAGVYGAASGDQGGFVALGGVVELSRRVSDSVELQSGLFIGAGGGADDPSLSGGGLMMRYHVGAELQTNQWGNFTAGLSYVDLPDGAIHSFQPYISYSYPFQALISSGYVTRKNKKDLGWRGLKDAEQELSLVYRYNVIPSSVVTDSGQPQNDDLGLMGVEWLRYFDDNFFFKVESAGAMQGESNGYLQMFLGGGYRYELFSGSWLKISGALGVAGGGNVDTGGGLLLDGQLSFQQRLTDHLFAELGGGYVFAPDASFEATSIAVKLGYHFYTPDISYGKDHIALTDVSSFAADNLRIRMIHQTYLQDSTNWRNHHVDQDVSLLGFQVDYFINPKFFLTGQGVSAYDGMAGGYLAGLVGTGVHLPLFNTPFSLEAEALVGAAGGGGLDVSGGFVWQGSAGVGYKISNAYSALGSYGYISAPGGDFRAKVVSLSLAYHFTLFTK